MKRHSFAIAAALLGLAWPASSAFAALVRTTFEGVITGNNPFIGLPAIGGTVSGQFTIDSAVLTGDGPHCAGINDCWSSAATSWSWNAQAVTLATETFPGTYRIDYTRVDRAPGAGADQLTIQLSGYRLDNVKLVLADPTGAAFESGGWGLFTQRSFSYVPLCVTGISCAFNPFYSGNLTSLVTTPVPEPGTAPLLLLGAAALAAALQRQRA
jgi:hypothetical protein